MAASTSTEVVVPAGAGAGAGAGRWRRDALAHTLGSRRLPEGVADAGERVPDAVAPGVMPFIRAADEVEQDSPRVAFLCKRSPLTHTL